MRQKLLAELWSPNSKQKLPAELHSRDSKQELPGLPKKSELIPKPDPEPELPPELKLLPKLRLQTTQKPRLPPLLLPTLLLKRSP